MVLADYNFRGTVFRTIFAVRKTTKAMIIGRKQRTDGVVTPYGIKPNTHSSIAQSQVTLDDLFTTA